MKGPAGDRIQHNLHSRRDFRFLDSRVERQLDQLHDRGNADAQL